MRGLSSIAIVGALFLSGCGDQSFPDVRYRLTIEVETPTGLKTGSSVLEVRSARYHAVLGEGGFNRFSRSLRGEAVAVDVAPGQTLFALLSENLEELPFRTLNPAGPPEGSKEDDRLFKTKRLLTMRGITVVPRWWPPSNKVDPPGSGYPLLVRFADVGNPATVAIVDPDDLASAFGAGVKLRKITIQITDDPVTSGIDARFTWFRKYNENGMSFSGSTAGIISSNALAENLGTGSLKRGEEQ